MLEYTTALLTGNVETTIIKAGNVRIVDLTFRVPLSSLHLSAKRQGEYEKLSVKYGGVTFFVYSTS